MSEWHDKKQQKTPSNILEQLRQRLVELQAKRELRKLTEQEQLTLTALLDIHTKLTNGEHVQNRRIATWLTQEQYSEYLDGWKEQKELREEAADKPHDIVAYEQLFRRAQFLSNRADGYSSKANSKQALKFRAQCESVLEDLLTHLEECLHSDPELRNWFDRVPEWTIAGDVFADIEAVPRVITTRSRLKQSDGLLHRKITKAEHKLEVIGRAVDALQYL